MGNIELVFGSSNEQFLVNLITKINFGEIDGYGDPNLEKYFLDDGYWDRIVNGRVFFVIGKKGTGKSSIYRMIEKVAYNNGDYVANKDFGDFPFEKLLTLSDESFSIPNQYQSIWKNLVLNIYAKSIVHCYHNESGNLYFEKIKEYVDICIGDVIDLHKEVINYTYKSTYGLTFKSISTGDEEGSEISLGNGSSNISSINSALLDLITNFFLTCGEEKKIIIQFDRLDDNYNQYQNKEIYYHAIISLFKTVYQLNQMFRAKNINNTKTVLYLRSDIYRALSSRDAESARWDDYTFNLTWAIINKDDWLNSKLMQLINKRIYISLPELGYNANFRHIFDNDVINLRIGDKQVDIFHYIIDRTMHRPRDLIQFCKFIQKEVCDTRKLYFRTIKNAEKNYADWLVKKEIANEINPIIKNTDALYDLLRTVGKEPFDFSQFREKYSLFPDIGIQADNLLYFLYEVGVIRNIDMSVYPYAYRSIIRNEGRLNIHMNMEIHTGVWKGLNV